MEKNSHLRGELFELLSTFSKTEMKKFGEFLNSPYHNKSPKLIKAFRFVKKFYPSFQDKRLTLENIHNSISPQIKYHEPTVRNELSDLYKLALRFLAVQSYLSNVQHTFDNILCELNQRNLINLFDRFVQYIQPVLNGTGGWNTELLLTNYNVNVHKTNKELVTTEAWGSYVKKTEEILKLYDKSFDVLNAFYISQLAEMYITLRLYNLDNDVDVRKTKIVKLSKSKMYKYMMQLLDNSTCPGPILLLAVKAFDVFSQFDNHSKYIEYKKTFLRFLGQLDNNEKGLHLTLLSAYCQRKKMHDTINRQKYSKEMLSLYDIMLTNGLYKYADNKFIKPLVFRNMIHAALEVEDITWINKLVNNHVDKLAKQDQDSMKNLGLMYLSFLNKNYDMSIEYANKIDSKYRLCKSDVNNTKVKIYYEKQNYDSALDLIRSYQKTIENSKLLSSASKLRHKNFLNVLKTLILVKQRKKILDNNVLGKLRLRAQSVNNNWLNQKVEEISVKMSNTRT